MVQIVASIKLESILLEVEVGLRPISLDRHAANICENVLLTRHWLTGNSQPGQYQHPEPHADSQGVVGRDEAIAGTKIDPLVSEFKEPQKKMPGLDDETVDVSRIEPMGEVREEML